MKMLKFDWVGLALYAGMAACIYVATDDSPTTEQIVATCSAQVLLVCVDVRSFRLGLEKGGEIVKDVWRIPK